MSGWIAVLACLAADMPFLPMATDNNSTFIDGQINRMGCTLILCDEDCRGQLLARHPDKTIITLAEGFQRSPHHHWKSEAEGQYHHDAYWITTSGSSGTPKTVTVSQQSLFNLLDSMLDFPGLHSMDRMLALAPISFDIALLELLLPLLAGACVEVADDSVRRDGHALGQLIDRSRVTVVQATQSTWLTLQASGWRSQRQLRAWVGGEPLTSQCAGYLLNQECVVYNVYGPTEATIWASATRITNPAQLMLGKPVHDTRFYVLNEHLESLPAGMTGELVIAGTALAQGYLESDQPGFIPASNTHPKLYRTGDTVRHEGNGQLFFIGRNDTQVKVLGQRVDLTEVEHALHECAPNTQWIAALSSSPSPHLCAYYQTAPNWQPDLRKITALLFEKLPAYAIPRRLVGLAEIPRTPHGKLERRNLDKLSELSATCRPKQEAQTPLAQPGPAINSKTVTDLTWPQLNAIIRQALDIDVEDPSLPFGWSGINSISLNQLSYCLNHQHDIAISASELISSVSPLGLLSKLTKTPHSSPSRFPSPAGYGTGSHEKIAIIAMHGELPGARDLVEFWQQQLNGICVISPSQRNFLRTAEGCCATFVSLSRGASIQP